MSDEETTFRSRVTRQGEEAIGRIAQELLESPVVSGALTAVFETRERAMRAQELAMGALNLPSAADLERLTRRVRSVSQRLEGIEDGLDRIDERLPRPAATVGLEERLGRIESLLERLETERVTDAVPSPSDPAADPPPAPTAKSVKPPSRRPATRSATSRSTAVSRAKTAAKSTGAPRTSRTRARKPAGG